jgi:hypothetical protein
MQEKQVTIYLPTKVDVERWQGLSKAQGSTLSRWIFEMVELALEKPTRNTQRITGFSTSPSPLIQSAAMDLVRATNLDELNSLRRENSELRRDLEQMTKLNARFRLQNFIESESLLDKIKPIEEEVKAGLRKGGTWSYKRLTEEFAEIDPRMLNRILQNLVDQKLVEELERGFRWKN